MITTIDKLSDLKKYDEYHLCFISEIPETVPEYTEYAKMIMSSPDYVPGKEYLDITDAPNPEFKRGESEFYAYFTPKPLIEQSGKDWNRASYIEFAELPDDKNTDIICISFAVHSYSYLLPFNWGYENTPFSVDDINGGAIAWIYDRNTDTKKSVAIYAGINPIEFFDKLKNIEDNNPGWSPKISFEL